jgi:hypothetical protein
MDFGKSCVLLQYLNVIAIPEYALTLCEPFAFFASMTFRLTACEQGTSAPSPQEMLLLKNEYWSYFSCYRITKRMFTVWQVPKSGSQMKCVSMPAITCPQDS